MRAAPPSEYQNRAQAVATRDNTISHVGNKLLYNEGATTVVIDRVRPVRLTPKSLSLLRESQRIAAIFSSPTITAEMLALACLENPSIVAGLTRAGKDPKQMSQELAGRLGEDAKRRLNLAKPGFKVTNLFSLGPRARASVSFSGGWFESGKDREPATPTDIFKTLLGQMEKSKGSALTPFGINSEWFKNNQSLFGLPLRERHKPFLIKLWHALQDESNRDRAAYGTSPFVPGTTFYAESSDFVAAGISLLEQIRKRVTRPEPIPRIR